MRDIAQFLSTLSLRRATRYSLRHSTPSGHFYPRSPCGERHATAKRINRNIGFLSTLSLRRATNGHETSPYRVWISIHALLAESDWGPRWIECHHLPFLSTLSLRRATAKSLAQGRDILFLSTLSLRRATRTWKMRLSVIADFYPRSPCGERPDVSVVEYKKAKISIHALLAESDDLQTVGGHCRLYFYPRSPCGERLMTCKCRPAYQKFLSTLSLRRATLQGRNRRN